MVGCIVCKVEETDTREGRREKGESEGGESSLFQYIDILVLTA